MLISEAWLCRRPIPAGYEHLFEMTTDYQISPLDGITFLTNTQVTTEFEQLVKYLGRYYPEPDEYYRECLTLGPVRVKRKPIYPNMPKTKLIINPSEGALSTFQVEMWLEFTLDHMAPAFTKISKVDSKVDIKGLAYSDVEHRLWDPYPFRKINAEQYAGETMYLGSRNSRVKRQGRIYDKAAESEQTGDHTRFEISRNYKPEERMTWWQFMSIMSTENPFKNLRLVNTDIKTMNRLMRRFGKEVKKGSILWTLKKVLNTYQRKAVLKRLDNMGALIPLDSEFEQQRDQWLQQSKAYSGCN